MQFEYKYIEFEGSGIDNKKVIDGLNELGKQGWRVVSELRTTSNYTLSTGAMFMRERR